MPTKIEKDTLSGTDTTGHAEVVEVTFDPAAIR